MSSITEFLTSINIWLAIAIVFFSVCLICYTFAVCVKLLKEFIFPTEYTEKNDFYIPAKGDPYRELYEHYEVEDYK